MTGGQRLDGIHLIVHIGTGKTGSSSIQKTLATNADGLRAQGVRYLGLMCEEAPRKLFLWQKPGGWPDLLKLGEAAAREQLEAVLAASLTQFAEAGMKRALWSNESIFGNDNIVIPVLKRLESSGVRSHVIVYIRRHDAWVRSAYVQWGIKHKTYPGPVKPFPDWYRDQKISFFAGLRPWLDHSWQDIAVRNFDACGDVVVDFLDYYGLAGADIAPRWDNETPNPVALALWAIYNSQVETPVLPIELQRLLVQSGLLQKASVGCDLADLLPTEADIETVTRDLESDRRKINEVFRRFGQPEMATSRLKPKAMTVSQGEINAALLLMIKHQSDQINALRAKVQRLFGADTDAERSPRGAQSN
jgi:hypothetical protein